MKKCLASLLVFSLVLSVSLAFADIVVPEKFRVGPSTEDLLTPPIVSNLEIHNDGGNNVWLEITIKTPDNVRKAIDYFENHELGYNQAGYIGGLRLQYDIDGKQVWDDIELNYSPNYNQDDDHWNGIFETGYLSELHVDSQVEARAFYVGATAEGYERSSDPSETLVLNEKVNFKASDWAIDEVTKANDAGLIPHIFDKEDLTKDITRKEFAHLAVILYEKLAGIEVKIASIPKNPFTDTDDVQVLWAYEYGITNGTSDTTFEPNSKITREQMATMMTRALLKAKIDVSVDLNKVKKFNDDDKMHSWGKDSIYFMSEAGIIKGMGDNQYGVEGTASREQAILISVRSAEKFSR
jgi:hypothetical protein